MVIMKIDCGQHFTDILLSYLYKQIGRYSPEATTDVINHTCNCIIKNKMK